MELPGGTKRCRNQVDKLSVGLQDLKKNIGKAFIEPATKVVASLNDMIDWLKSLDQETVTFLKRFRFP